MEELEKVFELMIQSFPIAKWYPEEISEIRELIKAKERNDCDYCELLGICSNPDKLLAFMMQETIPKG